MADGRGAFTRGGQPAEVIGQLLSSKEAQSGKYDVDQARKEHIYLKGLTKQANYLLQQGKGATVHNSEITETDRQQYPALYTIVRELGDGMAQEEYNALMFYAGLVGVKRPKFGRSLSSNTPYKDDEVDDSIKAVMDWARGKKKDNLNVAERELFTYKMAEEKLRKQQMTQEEYDKISKQFDGMMFPCVLDDLIKDAASELSSDVIAKAREEVTKMHVRQQVSMQLDLEHTQEQNTDDKGVRAPMRSKGEPSKSKEEKAREEEEMRKSLYATDSKDMKSEGKEERVLVSKEELDRLVNAEKMYRAQIDELTLRLSSFASKQMIDGNPNISDLSDANRPTKIGEKFSELYDDEWTDAFEGFTSRKVREGEALEALVDIIQLAYDFTRSTADNQLSTLQHRMCQTVTHVSCRVDGREMGVTQPKYDVKYLAPVNKYSKDFRKAAGLASVPSLYVLFKECCLKKNSGFNVERMNQPGLNEFIDKCVEYTWLMNIQDPPMCLLYAKEGDKINTNQFSAYKHKGTIVKQNVWPAVLLHRNGPLVKKGYVLPVK